MKTILIILIGFNLLFSSSFNFKQKKIFSTNSVIWGMDFIDEDKMIISLKQGEFLIFDLKKKEVIKKIDFEVFNIGQGGLMDVKVSPNFNIDSTIFFTYTKQVFPYGETTLAKARFKNDNLYDFEDILITKSNSTTGYHFGSRITFDNKNHIYFGVGDRGVRNNAQNLSNHSGTIIRLNLDGSIPKDNPFINNQDFLPQIYSYGHRNPQGIFYDLKNDKLWEVEHGPRGGDEVNLIKSAQNYGWPLVSLGKEYISNSSIGVEKKEGFIDAKKVYIPSIAPSSLVFYDKDIYKNLKGKLLISALKLKHINILTLDENSKIIKEERILEDLGERIRNIAISPKGLIYFSSDSGNLYLLENF